MMDAPPAPFFADNLVKAIGCASTRAQASCNSGFSTDMFAHISIRIFAPIVCITHHAYAGVLHSTLPGLEKGKYTPFSVLYVLLRSYDEPFYGSKVPHMDGVGGWVGSGNQPLSFE